MTRRPRPRRPGLLPAREIRESRLDDAAAAQHFACSVSMVALIRTGKRQPDAGGPIRSERPRRVVQGLVRTVKLGHGLAGRIDRARGEEPFGAWMRDAAEEYLRHLAVARERALSSITARPSTATPTDPPT